MDIINERYLCIFTEHHVSRIQRVEAHQSIISRTYPKGAGQREVNESFDSSFNTDNIRVSPGLGVRFIHKRIFNAVFRLDYGIGIGADASN